MRKVRCCQSLCPTAAAVQGQGRGQGQGCMAGSFEAGAGVGGSRASASTARPWLPAPGPGWGPGARSSQRTNAPEHQSPLPSLAQGKRRGKEYKNRSFAAFCSPGGGFSFSSNLGRSQANRDSATERFATKISPEKSHLCPSVDHILPPWSHPGGRRSPGWEQDTGMGTRVGATPRHIGHADPGVTLLRSRAARFLGCRLFSSLHHLKHLEHGQPQTGSHCLFIQAFTTIEKMEYGYTELQTMRSKMCWFSSDETEFQTENSEDKKKEKYLKKKPTYCKGSQQATPETEDKRGNKEPQKSEGN